MVKLNLLKQLEMLQQLNQQIKFDWKFGISKSSPQNYILCYVSQPIDSQIFINLVKYISKKQYRFPINELELNKEIEYPESVWAENEEKLRGIFPNVKPKNETLLSYRLNRFSVEKTNKGLVLRGDIVGLRKC